MKKIYLLLVLLFTGLQSVFAQFIWHPDLGTPYAGAISLPWDTRSYMFQVDNGEEFGSPGDIWDALDAQLRAAGITWIRVNSVENPADGTFEVWFDLDENKDNMSRSIHMGYSYSAYFIVFRSTANCQIIILLVFGGVYDVDKVCCFHPLHDSCLKRFLTQHSITHPAFVI